MLRFEAKYGAAMLQKHFGITDLSYSPELLYRFLQESSCILCKLCRTAFRREHITRLRRCRSSLPKRENRAEGAAGHMDCADLTHGQRLQGTPCALRGTFRLAV